jgi:hypothetical protein
VMQNPASPRGNKPPTLNSISAIQYRQALSSLETTLQVSIGTQSKYGGFASLGLFCLSKIDQNAEMSSGILKRRSNNRKLEITVVRYGPAPIVAGEGGQSEIAQTMHAQGFFWSYHPHSWKVRCGKMLTPMEVFLDSEKLWETLVKRANHGSVKSLTDSEIRKGLKSFAGAQGVSGFRPTAAWAVYDRFCPYRATVYDPSMGWGGRLIGAFMCPKVHRYIGCEPSTKTFEGLMQMEADLRWKVPSRGIEIEMHQRGSETFHPAPGSIDLVFTSPPYWRNSGIIENYADEDTQSHIRFADYGSWLKGFLGQTIRNSYLALKVGGILALNVSDELAGAVTEQAAKNGFVHLQAESLRLRLSKIIGRKRQPGGTWKTEPVLVFKRI